MRDVESQKSVMAFQQTVSFLEVAIYLALLLMTMAFLNLNYFHKVNLKIKLKKFANYPNAKFQTVNHNYIAFGLSQSQNMDLASIVECVHQPPGTGTFGAFTSWNAPGRSNSRAGIVSTKFKI
jgi:hypothetical protein